MSKSIVLVDAEEALHKKKEQWGFAEKKTAHSPSFHQRRCLAVGAPCHDATVTYAVLLKRGCGSCWAFSSVGAVEGIVQMKTEDLISLSEQELARCDNGSGGNFGCDGGWAYYTFGWITRNGVHSEENYPYTAQGDPRKEQKSKIRVASIDGREKVPANDEKALEKAVANQPVSVALHAGHFNFMLYVSGIISVSCATDLDHAVVVIGYGTSPAGKDFWILKNSWGLMWGENGYMQLQSNIAAPQGICGIAMDSSYPIKD